MRLQPHSSLLRFGLYFAFCPFASLKNGSSHLRERWRWGMQVFSNCISFTDCHDISIAQRLVSSLFFLLPVAGGNKAQSSSGGEGSQAELDHSGKGHSGGFDEGTRPAAEAAYLMPSLEGKSS